MEKRVPLAERMRPSSLDDFLLSYAKILTYYDIGNQNVRFVSTNLRQSLYKGVTDCGICNAVG